MGLFSAVTELERPCEEGAGSVQSPRRLRLPEVGELPRVFPCATDRTALVLF